MSWSYQGQLCGLILAAGIFLLVFILVRSRKLQEDFAILWLILSASLLILGLSRKLLEILTRLFGAEDTTTVLFFLGLMFLILIAIYFSTKLSKLIENQRNLIQNSALQNLQLEELNKKISKLESANSEKPES